VIRPKVRVEHSATGWRNTPVDVVRDLGLGLGWRPLHPTLIRRSLPHWNSLPRPAVLRVTCRTTGSPSMILVPDADAASLTDCGDCRT
jgi:hypothetical protein